VKDGRQLQAFDEATEFSVMSNLFEKCVDYQGSACLSVSASCELGLDWNLQFSVTFSFKSNSLFLVPTHPASKWLDLKTVWAIRSFAYWYLDGVALVRFGIFQSSCGCHFCSAILLITSLPVWPVCLWLADKTSVCVCECMLDSEKIVLARGHLIVVGRDRQEDRQEADIADVL